MSIRDLEKLNAAHMNSLQRKQKQEVSRLEEGHKNLKTEIKKAQDMEIVDLEHQNMQQVAGVAEKKEKVLEQMQSHLNETKRLTDREIKDLKDYAAKTKLEENEKLSVGRERIKTENDMYLDELHYRYGKELKKVTNDNQDQLEQMKNVRGQEVTALDSFHKDKINNQTNKFTEKFHTDARNYKKIKEDTDREFKHQRASTNIRQQHEMQKLTSAHHNTVEVRDDSFRKDLKGQELMFEQKYAQTLKTRNEELKTLDDLNKKVVAKMKGEMTEALKTTINRSDDSFYQFTELKPTLKQFEDRVEISVTVPEHSKADVQLTIHGKEAIVNFNRRYDDSRVAEGVTNKLHKVESFTTRLMTKHHLDAKTVKSSYEDGVMTYVVKPT